MPNFGKMLDDSMSTSARAMYKRVEAAVVPQEALDFVKRALEPDARKRPLLQSVWRRGTVDRSRMDGKYDISLAGNPPLKFADVLREMIREYKEPVKEDGGPKDALSEAKKRQLAKQRKKTPEPAQGEGKKTERHPNGMIVIANGVEIEANWPLPVCDDPWLAEGFTFGGAAGPKAAVMRRPSK